MLFRSGIVGSRDLKHIHVVSVTRKNNGKPSPDRLSCNDFKITPRSYTSWWSIAAPEYESEEAAQKAKAALSEAIPGLAICSFKELEAFLADPESKIDDKVRNGATKTITALRDAKLNANKRLAFDNATLVPRFNLDNTLIIYRSSASINEPGAVWTNAQSVSRSNARNANAGLPEGDYSNDM